MFCIDLRPSRKGISASQFRNNVPVSTVYQTLYRTVDVAGYVQVDTNRYSAPERLVGKEVEVHKLWDRVEVFFKNQKVADHPRLIDKRETRITAKGHHPPFNRQRAHEGPCNEEKALRGQQEWLDQFVEELKRRSTGRGVMPMRRLLDLKVLSGPIPRRHLPKPLSKPSGMGFMIWPAWSR